MGFIAKVISISHAQFHCNGLTSVQDIQVYASVSFFGIQCSYGNKYCTSIFIWFAFKCLFTNVIQKWAFLSNCIVYRNFQTTCVMYVLWLLTVV